MKASNLTIEPGGALKGPLRVPGDKSISHRAVMFGALADGTSRVYDCLLGEDVLATIGAFRAMGVEVTQDGGNLIVNGVGLSGLRAPSSAIDCGNSGTSMRLLAGILAGAGVSAVLTGDESLRGRPMRRVAEPLNRMGAQIETAGGTPPLRIFAGHPLSAIEYDLPVASAQVKSAILLAGLFARGVTRVREPAPTRDHSERMLRAFGATVETAPDGIRIAGGQRLRATDITVPADISSAAFFIVGAAIAPGSDIELHAVGINPTRTGIIDIMRAMGADITVANTRELGGEPVADLRVRSSELKGIEIPMAAVPLAIDEFPAIFIAAACAHGRTTLHGAAELRHKESDRIAVMAAGLTTLGITVETFADGIAIEGAQLTGGAVDARGDHRIAMAFAMSALRALGPIVINNAEAIATSFPGFAKLAADAGLRIRA